MHRPFVAINVRREVRRRRRSIAFLRLIANRARHSCTAAAARVWTAATPRSIRVTPRRPSGYLRSSCTSSVRSNDQAFFTFPANPHARRANSRGPLIRRRLRCARAFHRLPLGRRGGRFRGQPFRRPCAAIVCAPLLSASFVGRRALDGSQRCLQITAAGASVRATSRRQWQLWRSCRVASR